MLLGGLCTSEDSGSKYLFSTFTKMQSENEMSGSSLDHVDKLLLTFCTKIYV